ncbi:hypothetical protein QBC44DRAFT_357425 [Cladorrhinum sp. PSN332]|nr:hypothetical protein QBC44DRAFT_357425 [Cladorrhinum sp. PSN332]
MSTKTPQQPPGHLVGPMLWLVPRYPDASGQNSIYKLGSILKDPHKPGESLNLSSIPGFSHGLVRDVSSHVRQYVKAELTNSNSLLAKAVLPTIGGSISVEATDAGEAVTSFDAVNVKAKAFKLDGDSLVELKKFMNEAVKSQGVVEYVREQWFEARLYMIVGVATAGKLSLKETSSSKRTVNAGVGVNVGDILGNTEVKPGHSREGKTEGSLDVTGECDFAYRVREFVYSEKKGVRVGGNVSKGAMFGSGDDEDGGQVEGEVETVPEFVGFEKDDVALEDGSDVVTLQVVIPQD